MLDTGNARNGHIKCDTLQRETVRNRLISRASAHTTTGHDCTQLTQERGQAQTHDCGWTVSAVHGAIVRGNALGHHVCGKVRAVRLGVRVFVCVRVVRYVKFVAYS